MCEKIILLYRDRAVADSGSWQTSVVSADVDADIGIWPYVCTEVYIARTRLFTSHNSCHITVYSPTIRNNEHRRFYFNTLEP